MKPLPCLALHRVRFLTGLKNLELLKKKSLIYAEGDLAKQEAFLETIKDIPEGDLVYIDEAGFEEKDGERTHAYAPRGERAPGQISGKRSVRQNVIAGLCDKEIVAPVIYEGAMNAVRYEEYMVKRLIPKLRPGQIIIQDNARFHKISDQVRRALDKHKCKILNLPPYSPQLNTIERLWGCMKSRLKQMSDCLESLPTKLGQLLANRYFRAEKNGCNQVVLGHK